MTDDELTTALTKGMENVVKFVTAGERLTALMRQTRFAIQELTELYGKDPGLEPELEAAGTHLVAAAEAMARGVEFAAARAHVEAEKL